MCDLSDWTVLKSPQITMFYQILKHMIRYHTARWILWNSSRRSWEFGWICQNSNHSNLCALKWQHHQTEFWDVCQSLVTVCLKHLKWILWIPRYCNNVFLLCLTMIIIQCSPMNICSKVSHLWQIPPKITYIFTCT